MSTARERFVVDGRGRRTEVILSRRRYEQMLEDLRLVQKNEAPKFARRAVDLETLAKIEETGKTVDLAPSPIPSRDNPWKTPQAMILAWVAGAAIFLDIILVILLVLMHK